MSEMRRYPDSVAIHVLPIGVVMCAQKSHIVSNCV